MGRKTDDSIVTADYWEWRDYKYPVNNSFGFGRHNVAIAFGRY